MRALTCLGARNVLTNCFTSRGQLGQQFSEMAFNLGRCPLPSCIVLPPGNCQYGTDKEICVLYTCEIMSGKKWLLSLACGENKSLPFMPSIEEGRAPTPKVHNNVTYTKPNCFVRFDRAHLSFSVLFTWYYFPKSYKNNSLLPKKLNKYWRILCKHYSLSYFLIYILEVSQLGYIWELIHSSLLPNKWLLCNTVPSLFKGSGFHQKSLTLVNLPATLKETITLVAMVIRGIKFLFELWLTPINACPSRWHFFSCFGFCPKPESVNELNERSNKSAFGLHNSFFQEIKDFFFLQQKSTAMMTVRSSLHFHRTHY